MPCNCARADGLKKGELLFISGIVKNMYGIYLSLFWAQCTVNFLKPHRFSVILLLLFPTRHIEQIFRLPPPIFGLLLVTIGKQRVCVVLHVPHVSLLQQQVFTGGNKAVTAALSGHHSPIHECQI